MNIKDLIKKLDGVAAVNLDEPSEGDLERVVKAYAECRKERDELEEDFQLMRKERGTLREILDAINRRVMPGDIDSIDSLRLMYEERKAQAVVIDQLRVELEKEKFYSGECHLRFEGQNEEITKLREENAKLVKVLENSLNQQHAVKSYDVDRDATCHAYCSVCKALQTLAEYRNAGENDKN